MMTHNCCCQHGCATRCSNQPPAQATITLAGIINGVACSHCPDYATTYIINNNGGLNGCAYGGISGNGSLTGSCNSGVSGVLDIVSMTIVDDGAGHTKLQVQLDLENYTQMVWRSGSMGSSPVNCQSRTVSCPLVTVTNAGASRCLSDGSDAVVTL